MGSELEHRAKIERILQQLLDECRVSPSRVVRDMYVFRIESAIRADDSALRARVAELESKLAESEDWKNSLANDVIRTSHENMELQAKLAAATKRAGEEKQDGN